MQLIDAVNSSKRHVPVIAFSQNFAKDKELMLQVTNRNAFPMQKNYNDNDNDNDNDNEVNFQPLGAAILYLTRDKVDKAIDDPLPANGKNFWDVVSALPIFLIPIIIVGCFAVLILFAQINTEPGNPVNILGIPLFNKAPQ